MEDRFACAGIVLCACMAACGASDDVAPVVARDSAGVQIFSNSGMAPGYAGGSLTPLPLLTIGKAEGDSGEVLYFANDAHLALDGTIRVANGGTGQVLFYDSLGYFIRSLGRPGEGPGEFGFGSPRRICTGVTLLASPSASAPGAAMPFARSDVLLAYDGGQMRLNVFTAEGVLTDTWSLIRVFPDARLAYVAGCFHSGDLLLGSWRGESRGPPGTLIHSTDSYVVADLATQQAVGTPVDQPARPRYANQVGGITHYPFLPYTIEPVATPWGDEFVLGTGEQQELRVHDRRGELKRIIRWVDERTRTRDIHDDYTRQTLESVEDADFRRLIQGLHDSDAPFPEFVPAYIHAKEDVKGNLWVERFRMPGDTLTSWYVFDPDGQWLTAMTGRSGKVHQILEDRLIVRVLDSLGVETIRVYGFQPLGWP